MWRLLKADTKVSADSINEKYVLIRPSNSGRQQIERLCLVCKFDPEYDPFHPTPQDVACWEILGAKELTRQMF
jgi:hypothetical protein